MGSSKSKPACNIVCVGLDNAGKTTIINSIKPERDRALEVVPTIGFNTEKFKYDAVNLTVHDMAGAKQYRSLWKENLDDAQGIIFVVDAADHLRVCIAEAELAEVAALAPPAVPILVLCNKADLEAALASAQLSTALNAASHCAQRRWHLLPCSALTGEGVEEGMGWLLANLAPSKGKGKK